MNPNTGEIREITEENQEQSIREGFTEPLREDEVNFLKGVPEHQRKEALEIYRKQKAIKMQQFRNRKVRISPSYGNKTTEQKAIDKKKRKSAKKSRQKNRRK